ncbi:Putative zinc finger and SCAN domain-containing protein 5D [Frankliniella fusca]|uniref:Zinc finger and SCAN domain-containing protein 5D n=1 Tax=Frankliniella fusca TaxID=407009 RepID=A0AAE1HAR1_9NEOP|nr:Putative zinc finger and SCAN domain-containing protein 5D [Frankliniella fusca]
MTSRQIMKDVKLRDHFDVMMTVRAKSLLWAVKIPSKKNRIDNGSPKLPNSPDCVGAKISDEGGMKKTLENLSATITSKSTIEEETGISPNDSMNKSCVRGLSAMSFSCSEDDDGDDDDKEGNGMKTSGTETTVILNNDCQSHSINLTSTSNLFANKSANISNSKATYVCSPLCGSSALLIEIKEIVQSLEVEVHGLKKMNQDLQQMIGDLKEQPSTQGFPSVSLNSCDPSGMVDLGGNNKIDREWAEKVVREKILGLKWKLSKLLMKLFDKETLYHFWFDKSCIVEEEGDLEFPDSCVEKIHEFFDLVNTKWSKMEIIKQQQKIRERTTDPNECARLCEQVHANIMLQNGSVQRQEIKTQIGKILYDVKIEYRKEHNLPPRKPRRKCDD